MGMAASQARYLALVARKSNCEYEGQQINQSRLILSNQSANLFTQMLGLEVPTPPSKEDYKYIQYSFKDGVRGYTMDKWVQLDEDSSDGYNYAVTYHYNKDEQQGAQKIRSNPQVQFSNKTVPPTTYETDIAKIQTALEKIKKCQADYDKAVEDLTAKKNEAKLLSTFADPVTSNFAKSAVLQSDGSYLVTRTDARYINNTKYLYYSTTDGGATDRYYDYKNDTYYTSLDPLTPDSSATHNYYSVNTTDTYKNYADCDADIQTKIDNALKMLKSSGALPETTLSSRIYYSDTLKAFALADNLENVGKASVTESLPLYYLETADVPTERGLSCVSMEKMEQDLTDLQNAVDTAKGKLESANSEYAVLNVPKYIGNNELTPIYELTDAQLTAVNKIINSMKDKSIPNRLSYCFDGNGNYIGGLYTYEVNNVTYYSTYFDLADSVRSGTGINNIDDQMKLPIYNVQTVSVPVENTEKAVLETDAKGRFTSIRLESDSVTYSLTTESHTDEDGYQDAMNQYDYEKALYDKRVSDLNAQTSIIQRQDQDLELRLKQLDTEQNALSTEIDAVAKVVKDNVEKSFKTFGG